MDVEMIVIPEGVYRRGRSDGRLTATVKCPDCGRWTSIANHDIAADGTVSPSIVCPHGGCKFHAYVQLGGWRP